MHSYCVSSLSSNQVKKSKSLMKLQSTTVSATRTKANTLCLYTAHLQNVSATDERQRLAECFWRLCIYINAYSVEQRLARKANTPNCRERHYTHDTHSRNRRHEWTLVFLAPVSGIRVSCKSGTGFIWHQIPAPIRMLFCSKRDRKLRARD